MKHLIDHLGSLQAQLIAITGCFSDHDCHQQFHPDISPAGWHLGHTVFVENFWIRETILEKPVVRADRQLYLPENSPRTCRARQLPTRKNLLCDSATRQCDNLKLLRNPPRQLKNHALMKDNYLILFLIQHHAMHLETLYMELTERSLQKNYRNFRPAQKLDTQQTVNACYGMAGGCYSIGSDNPECFDNERPVHAHVLPDFALGKSPVSNAEYLGFIRADGYRNPHYWSPVGWQWCRCTRPQAPHHWRTNGAGEWFGIDDKGAYTLQSADPVYGLCYYEAEAFAKWARARLPHEHELEIAQRTAAIPSTATWEWCHNAFRPYTGFRAFPYEGYSVPWFDRRHFVLKGGSRYTDTMLKRPSIRNFYPPEKRHIFAGLRLAFDRRRQMIYKSTATRAETTNLAQIQLAPQHTCKNHA